MSFVWYHSPDFMAPYRSTDIEESCVLAYDYFSLILDHFIEKLPEDRLPLEFTDWLDEKSTLADRVHLIFPNGFGKFDPQKNHNPDIFPWMVHLSDYVRADSHIEYAEGLCESWKGALKVEVPIENDVRSLQAIFDFFTSYLQLFVVLSDGDAHNLDFKYPPVDECGIMLGSTFRSPYPSYQELREAGLDTNLALRLM